MLARLGVPRNDRTPVTGSKGWPTVRDPSSGSQELKPFHTPGRAAVVGGGRGEEQGRRVVKWGVFTEGAMSWLDNVRVPRTSIRSNLN
jgi:hypothetical protein